MPLTARGVELMMAGGVMARVINDELALDHVVPALLTALARK